MEELNNSGNGSETLNETVISKKIQKAREDINRIENIPEGYIEVVLSTRGKIGAPERFFIRNFSPEDLMDLGLSEEQDFPIRLIKVLDRLIYNPNNDPVFSVKNFHEKEVIELLLLLYETFYTTIFPNQQWIPTEEDFEFLKAQCGGETDEYFQKVRALENGGWKPVFDIDISKDLSFWEIDENIKTKAKIDRKYGEKEFSAVFTLPKFGDFITLKYFMDSIFKEDDKKFAAIADMHRRYKEAEDKLFKGADIDIRRVPQAPKAELDKLRDYEAEKTLFSITAAKALYISEFDGKDVSTLPLEKKLEIAKDPRLDYTTFKMVQDHFNEMQFGIKEDITVHDPIIGKVVTRKFTFQLNDLLIAIRDSRTTQTNISFV